MDTVVLLDRAGAPIELRRNVHEVVLLAFDPVRRQFAELHMIDQSNPAKSGVGQRSMERLREWQAVRTRSFPRVHTSGTQGRHLHYTCDLNDGEPFDSYLDRTGALAPAVAFRLMGRMLDDLVFWLDSAPGIERITLDNLMVVSECGSQVALRITDLGIFQNDPRLGDNYPLQQLCVEACRMLLKMLVGPTSGEATETAFPALTCLNTRIRIILRDAVEEPELVPASLIQIRYHILEAANALPKDANTLPPAPHSVLKGKLCPALEAIPSTLSELVSAKLRTESDADRHAIDGVDSRRGQPARLHWLPAQDFLTSTHVSVMPHGAERLSPERWPWVRRVLDHGLTANGSWVTEEGHAGCSLAEFVAARRCLLPDEVTKLLQLLGPISRQALRDGAGLTLHPSDIQLIPLGSEGPQSKEHLLATRLNEWPEFNLKVRVHLTLSQLIDPQFASWTELASPELVINATHRSMVHLAAHLLTGEWPDHAPLLFPNHLPPALTLLMTESLAQCREGKAPGSLEFLARFDQTVRPTRLLEVTNLRDIIGREVKAPRDLKVASYAPGEATKRFLVERTWGE